jgi:hypothetical protein
MYAKPTLLQHGYTCLVELCVSQLPFIWYCVSGRLVAPDDVPSAWAHSAAGLLHKPPA